jgi:hypothetical protein
MALAFWLDTERAPKPERFRHADLADVLGVSTTTAWRTWKSALRGMRLCLERKRLESLKRGGRLLEEWHELMARARRVRARLEMWQSPKTDHDYLVRATKIAQSFGKLLDHTASVTAPESLEEQSDLRLLELVEQRRKEATAACEAWLSEMSKVRIDDSPIEELLMLDNGETRWAVNSDAVAKKFLELELRVKQLTEHCGDLESLDSTE